MKKWLVFILFSFVSILASAQKHEFTNYSELGIIPTQSVSKIYLDPKGYLWITGNKGLYKVRGRHSKFFSASDGLPLDYIANISTYEGDKLVINCFDPSFKSELAIMEFNQPGKFKPFLQDFTDLYGQEFITRVYKDSKNKIWINTRKSLYCKSDGDSTYKKIFPDTLDNSINFIVVDDWVAINHQEDPYVHSLDATSRSFKINILENNHIRHYKLPIISKNTNLKEERRCLRLSNGDIVYIVSNILYLLKKDLSIEHKMLASPVLHLYEDSKKGLWISFEKGLLHIEDMNKLGITQEYLTDKLMNAVCEDMDGGIWAGSTESGIFHSSGKGFNRLPNSKIVAVDTAFGNLYVSDRNGYLICYELDENKNLKPKYQFDNHYPNFILSIRPLNHQLIITDLYGQSKVLDSTLKDTGVKVSDKNVLGSNFKALLTGTFLVDHSGEVIIHANDSIIFVKSKKSLQLPKSIKGINSIHEDNDRNIMLGTDSGLIVLSKNRFYRPGQLIPILNDRILTIQCDDSNRYWILFKLHGLIVVHSTGAIWLSKELGLDPQSIRDIDLDNNHAWISSLDGLFLIQNLNIKKKKFESFHFGYENGLIGEEVYGVSILKNYLFVNAKQGLFYISLKELNTSQSNNNRLDIFTQEDKEIMNETIHFKSDTRKIVFRIETTAYRHFRHPKYYYSINGTEENILDGTDEISLQDMKYGNYEMSIRSAYNNEEKSGRTIRFSIEKPLWAKTWFIALILIIVGMLIAYLFFKRVSSIRKKADEKIKFENLISEYKIKSLQAQMNPHFLFNMLNTIYSMSMIKSDKTPEVIMRLSALLRFMLYEIEKEWIPIETEINIIKEFIALQLFRFENKVTVTQKFNSKNDQQLIKPLLMFPIIENAFKHGIGIKSDKSFVNIDIQLIEDSLYLRTENKIMKEENHLHDGSGLGLSNIKKQLELIYTDYDLKTYEENGTFIVTLFINLSSYDTTTLPNR